MAEILPVVAHRWRELAADGLPARRQCANCSLYRLAGYDGPAVPCDPRRWEGRNPPPLTAEHLAASLAHGEAPELVPCGDPRLVSDGTAGATLFAPCRACSTRVVAVFRGHSIAAAICRGCQDG